VYIFSDIQNEVAMSHKSAPTTTTERIRSLDVLRGFALLGILIINIQSFSMPGAAYLNPSSFGDFEGINKWIWAVTFAIGETKFMAIFSMLFGAGIVLVTQKAEAKTGKSAGLHYRRNFWLLVFGFVHAHLIWYGDILVAYAAVHTILYALIGVSMSSWTEADLTEAVLDWAPTAEMIASEIAMVTGSIGEQISHNSESAVMMETLVFFVYIMWRAGGLMLVGMALYKWNVLSAGKSKDFYKKGMLIGWLIGFPLIIYGIYTNFKHDWSYEYSMFSGGHFNYWGSLGVSFGYICMIMLMVQSGGFSGLKRRLAAVGQMAFTNYITVSYLHIYILGVGSGIIWTSGEIRSDRYCTSRVVITIMVVAHVVVQV